MTAPGQSATSLTTYRRRVLYQIAMFAMILGYSAQIVTPLRLHPDTVVLLSVADSAAHGGGFLIKGRPTVFPPGYPALVAFLQKFGLAHNWVLVAFNTVSFIVGLWAVSHLLMLRMFNNIVPVLNVCLVSSLSLVFIKYVSIPLTDSAFFGLAMCSLALVESASHLSFGRRFWWLILASWVLAAAALTMRRVGLALIPALLWSILCHKDFQIYISSRFHKIVAILGIGCAGAVTAWIVMETSTLRDRQAVLAGRHFSDVLGQILIFRIKELTAITLNVPPPVLPPTLRPVGLFLAALFLVLILTGVSIQRNVHPTTVFLFSYFLIVFTWPFYDPRFWLPVIPLIMAYAGLAIQHVVIRHQWFKIFVRCYVATFALIGTIALGWSTMVTFSGSRFPDTYYKFSSLLAVNQDELQFAGLFRSTYSAACRSCEESQDDHNRFAWPKIDANGVLKQPDQAALHVLQTYK